MIDTIAQVLGWLGAFLIVLAYLLLSHKKLHASDTNYQLLNILGALGVGINAYYQHSWPSLTLQVVWIAIALSTFIKS